MNVSEPLTRTLRLHLVDSRDEALHALRQFKEVDDPSERVRTELAAATHIFELELDSHAEQKVLEDPAVIISRDEWSAGQYAERIEELLRLFDDLGFGGLVQ